MPVMLPVHRYSDSLRRRWEMFLSAYPAARVAIGILGIGVCWEAFQFGFQYMGVTLPFWVAAPIAFIGLYGLVYLVSSLVTTWRQRIKHVIAITSILLVTASTWGQLMAKFNEWRETRRINQPLTTNQQRQSSKTKSNSQQFSLSAPLAFHFSQEHCMTYDPTSLFIHNEENSSISSLRDNRSELPFRLESGNDVAQAALSVARLFTSICWAGDPVTARQSNNGLLVRWGPFVSRDHIDNVENAIYVEIAITASVNPSVHNAKLPGLQCFHIKKPVVSHDLETGPFHLSLDGFRRFRVESLIESKAVEQSAKNASTFCIIGHDFLNSAAVKPINDLFAFNVLGFFYE